MRGFVSLPSSWSELAFRFLCGKKSFEEIEEIEEIEEMGERRG